MTDQPRDNQGRRSFFREAAKRLVDPVADLIERKTAGHTPRPILRPPGAIAESQFNDTCRRCGECVAICPADAIKPLRQAFGDLAGSPAVDPSLAPCVVCEGLQCTHVCPSGALLPVYEPHLIDMGVAEVYSSICVRTEGTECTECVDRCPLGKAAIRFDGDGPPRVFEDGCVGCGVCEFYCPTTPKAITVRLT